MLDVPKKIYLQIGDEAYNPEDFKEIPGISWCEYKVYENDIEYTLSDPTEPLIAELIHLYNKHGEESTRLVLEAYKKAKEATG